MKKIFTFILVLMSLAIPSIAMAAANNVITYTSTTGKKVEVPTSGWTGVTLISNTYTGGVGTITFSGTITNIAEEAFDGCDTLKSIVLPSSVTSIGRSAFDDCESLMEIQVDAYFPPTVGKNAFRAVPEGCNVYVPCGRVADYKAAAGWKNFDYIQEAPSPYILKLLVKEPERGVAEIVQHNACGTEIKASSNYGYHFLKWDDNNTDSVRSLTPSYNLTLTASFGKNKYTITTDLNNPGAGTVSGGQTVEYLDTVTLKADPNFGWRFTNWEDGNTDNPRIVVVERDLLFKAIFVPKNIVLKTVNQDVCDGGEYLDTYTGVLHTIDSSDPSSLTWQDSVRTATEDIVYTFVINPTVAPAMLTLAQLKTIGAVPTLVPGTFPNTTASVTAILNHYKTADTKSLADVTSASWSMDKVACGATEHTMVLTVVCGCATMVETFTFPVVSTTETRNETTEACESYFWPQTSETYTTTGVYRDTVPSKAGCDSIYYVLDLKIWQPAYTLVKDTICEGDYYNDVQYFASTTLSNTLATSHGCDSVVEVKLTVWPKDTITTSATICYGDTYEWHGASYSTTGTYTFDTLTVHGCNSHRVLNLSVLPEVKDSVINKTLCEGEGSFTWNGTTYTLPGTYVDTIFTKNASLCDSLVILNLTILPKVPETFVDTTVCYGESFVWTIDGATYTLSGTKNKSVTLSSVNGCDSVVTLRLVELPEVATVPESATICAGETYIWNGAAYTASSTYNVTLADVNGCDSIATLNLTVLPAVADSIANVTICAGESYLWVDGNSYTVTTMGKVTTLPDANGCPQKHVLNLTVLPAVKPTVVKDTICADSTYLWFVGSNTYSYSVGGTYADTLQDVNGCDSVVVLELTQLAPIAETFVDDTVCYGETYTWIINGTTYTLTGTQEMSVTLSSVNGCDSVVTLRLVELPEVVTTPESATICTGETYTWNGAAYTSTGTYTMTLSDVNGCDSVATLNLTVLPANPEVVTIDTICAGESYVWVDGVSYTVTTSKSITVTGANGCPEKQTLNLTVLPVIKPTIQKDTICAGEPYVWTVGSHTYTYSVGGTYADTLITPQGCDSVVVLELTQLAPIAETFVDTTVCYGESFVWTINGATYTLTGTQNMSVTLNSVNNCDSVVTLRLVELPEVVTVPESATICTGETYTWNGTAYATSGTYTVTLSDVNGCDSVATLNLTVLPANPVTVDNATICVGETYIWTADGKPYTSAIDTTITLVDVNGCDSVVNLKLTVFPAVPESITYDTICAGDTLIWQGKIYTKSVTNETVTLTSVNGCDSVLKLNLHVLPPVADTTEYMTICHGDIYVWPLNSKAYTTSQIDSVKELTAQGCERIVYLDLTVLPEVLPTLEEVTICAGDTFVWSANGQKYFEDKIVTETLVDVNGCDSVVKLDLTVLPIIPITTTIDTICAGDAYTWAANGEVYTSSIDTTITLTSINGCDSVVNLKLTILPEISETIITETTCYGETYTWPENGVTYTKSATASVKYITAHGCDSVITLNLTVLPKLAETRDTVYLCYGESYTWPENGLTYTTAATDTAVLRDLNGCDSVIILTLIALPEIPETIIKETFCYGESYTWPVTGTTYTTDYLESVTLTSVKGCDSIVTLDLTMLPAIAETVEKDTICAGDVYTWDLTGDRFTTTTDTSVVLTSVNGCDSIVALQLYVRSVDTTWTKATICAGDTLTWEGEKFYYTAGDTKIIDLSKSYTSFLTNCDSVVQLNLTILAPIDTTWVYDYICSGESFIKNGVSFNADTTLYTTKTSINGCDSVIAWNLHVWPAVDTTVVYDSICIGDTLSWHGNNYAEPGTYQATIQDIHGCDSTVIMHLNVNYPVTVELSDTVCDSITWNGALYTATGDYSFTTTGSNGCDSTTILHLTVNYSAHTDLFESACDSYTWINTGDTYTASGIYYKTLTCVNGCDSVVALNLTINNTTSSILDVMTCNGESYLWHDSIYTTSTVDTVILTNAVGCDSLAILHLTIMPKMQYDSISLAVCPSELPYAWYGQTLTAAGEYKHREQFASFACDSVEHVLNFVVLPTTTSHDTIVTCDSLTWNGITYTISGDYCFTTTGSNGCDSVANLHLIVNYTTTSLDSMTICYGDTYTWNDSIYDATGEYVHILTNAAGCDSIATLHLTILPEMLQDSTNVIVCPSELPYLWNGQELITSGEYKHREQFASFACDSIEHVLNLEVLPIVTSHDTIVTCDNLTWNGITYTASGDYTFTTTGSNGCDSVANLHLIVHNSALTNLYETACDSFVWENTGETYLTSGAYYDTLTTVNGCDSVVVLNLTVNFSTVGLPEVVTLCYGETYDWNGVTYDQSGEYAVTLTNAAGCDSTAYLHLTILPEMEYDYQDIYACPSELPYRWYGHALTVSGEYRVREQFAGTSCDSVEHVLNFVVYDMSLPTTVTTPIAVCGNSVDVTIPTAEIEAYIASIADYAPAATVTWFVNKSGIWEALTSEIVTGNMNEIVLKYVISTTCGDLESEVMIAPVEMPTPENDLEMDNMEVLSKYNNRIFLFHLKAFETKFGWRPRPEQVTWFKVVGEVDVYGEFGDDEVVGTGHSYNLPDGENIVGSYYALIEQTEVDLDGCTGIYRTQIVTSNILGVAPRLVPNVVHPSEAMTLQNLDPNAINEIRVYSTTGELIAIYTAEKVNQFILQANHTQGYYLVDVINENEKITLRYLVK